MARRLAFVRREVCPSCGADFGVTRAELAHGIATCRCGARLALDVRHGGDGPIRAMQLVESRVMMPGPPTTHIEETLKPPRLRMRQVRSATRDTTMAAVVLGGMAVLFGCMAWFFSVGLAMLSVLAGVPFVYLVHELLQHERLDIGHGALVHRSLGGRVSSVPLAELRDVEVRTDGVLLRSRDGELRVLDPELGHDEETRAWVAAWIREHSRRS